MLRTLLNKPECLVLPGVYDALTAKIAAKAGNRYIDLLNTNEKIVAKQVTENIYERHMKPLFL